MDRPAHGPYAARWDRWGRDGHEMVRTGDLEWACERCGAVSSGQRTHSGLPDDNWMGLPLPDGTTASEIGLPGFEDYHEAQALVVEAVQRS